MSDAPTYQGSCFCGNVRFEVTGEPVAAGYCHCDSCRRWSASPINAFSLWKPEAVKVTRGADRIGTYNKTEKSYRKWCRDCGGHIFTDHPGFGLVDVYAGVLPELPFDPHLHVFYEETVLRVRDGLPKMADIPAELGGSGRTLPE